MMKHRKINFNIPTQRIWYYVVASYGGRTLIDKKNTEQEAYNFGYEKLQVPFEVVELPTKDIKRAKSIIRDMKLQKGEGIEQSMKPIFRLK